MTAEKVAASKVLHKGKTDSSDDQDEDDQDDESFIAPAETVLASFIDECVLIFPPFTSLGQYANFEPKTLYKQARKDFIASNKTQPFLESSKDQNHVITNWAFYFQKGCRALIKSGILKVVQKNTRTKKELWQVQRKSKKKSSKKKVVAVAAVPVPVATATTQPQIPLLK